MLNAGQLAVFCTKTECSFPVLYDGTNVWWVATQRGALFWPPCRVRPEFGDSVLPLPDGLLAFSVEVIVAQQLRMAA